MKRVAVFCGSRTGTDPIYAEQADQLGRALAERGLGLVYGAGSIGLMGVVARAVMSAGGEVIGVIPDALAQKEIALTDVTEFIVVRTMHERKAIMADRADAFLALPGGFGTCDELFEILTWAQLGIHRKPIAILNTQNFFDPMIQFIDQMVDRNFLSVRNRNLLMVSDTIPVVLDLLQSFRPAAPTTKWLDLDER